MAEGNPENRDKAGRFQKGKTGNPGGRPSIPQEFKDLALKYSVPALKKAIEIMQDDENKTADKLKAIELILDRGIGKPTQTLDVGNKEGEAFRTANVDLSHLTIEQIKELLEDENKADT